MLLNAIPSLYVNSNLVRSGCFEWSSSDEEIPKDSVNARERLRGGGSKFKLTTTRHKPSNPTRRESCRRTDDKELRIRDPKPKTFAKLKTKLSTAKQAMFRKKKGDTDVTIRGDRSTNISVADVCERCNSETVPLLKSSKTLRQGRSSGFKCDVKLQNKKSLLIPDLNLKPIFGDNPSIERHEERRRQVLEASNSSKTTVLNTKHIKDRGEPDDSRDRNPRQIKSQYETAMNNSSVMGNSDPRKIPEDNHVSLEKRVAFKMVELTRVPPVYWKKDGFRSASQIRNANSLPFISGKPSDVPKPRETKTACLLNSQQETQFPAPQYPATQFPATTTKSSKNSRRSKETKNSSVHNENVQEYGAISNDVIEKDSPIPAETSRHLEHYPYVSHDSVKYLFKNRIGQGDHFSTRSWMDKIQSHESDESETLLAPKPQVTLSTCLDLTPLSDAARIRPIEKPAQRFYVLLMFCAVTCMQVIVSNTWNSIADSVLFAFPYCKPNSIALLSNWGSLSLLFCILPVCYLLHKKGLRISILLACGLCTLGAGIRCLPLGPDRFILLAHIGSILNAMGGVTYGPAIVMLSSTWFPADERTFATGVGTSLSLLGVAATYFLGPLMVSDPTTYSKDSDYVRELIRDEILFYMTLAFMAELCLFTLLVFCFPDKPEHPTSKASSVSLSLNLSCLESVKLLIKNRPVTLLAISSGLLSGAASPWLSLLTMILTQLNISQSIAANIGFWTMICGCVLGLVVSKLSDQYPGYIKQNLVTFASLSTVMFTWIALMILSSSPGKLLAAVLIGISSSWATSALFYELGAEIAYPVPESIVAGFMSSVSSLAVATVNAYIYFFSFVDISWLNYALVLFSLCSVLCLIFVNAVYNRSKLDRSNINNVQ
ncbi:hypothetical protein M8J76_014588 [Diaphorina citri]|nr:hypothetical protein M8J76_014588 [Diaphorina citri]